MAFRTWVTGELYMDTSYSTTVNRLTFTMPTLKVPAPEVRRQGDVLLVPVSDVRKDKLMERKRDNGRLVLAYGEESGHAHAVLDDTAKLFDEIVKRNQFRTDERVILSLDTDTEIVHEEHPPIKLPAGDYEVRRQRQYRPDSEPEWVYD